MATIKYWNGSAWELAIVGKQGPAGATGPTGPDSVTTKGDIATYSTTPTRLPVGANGETLVADSSASTGLRWQGTYAGGKNFLINGGFDIWQRGTSSSTQGVTTADRWFNVIGGTTTFSQDTSVPTNANVQYSHKWTTGASSSFGQFYQTLERDVVRPLRGLTMTFSFWVRHTGTAFTGVLNADVLYSNSTDAYVSVSTAVTFTGATNITPTGTWTRYSATFTVPSDAIGLKVGVLPTQVQASGVVVYLAACQLEVGSVATAFSRAGGTLAGELAACQRYYYRQAPSAIYANFGWGNAETTGTVNVHFYLPVTMRTAPTSLDTSAMNTFLYQTGGTSSTTPTTITMNANQTTANLALLQMSKTTSFTVGAMYLLGANNTSTAYLGVSAEL